MVNSTRTRLPVAQLSMPGIPERVYVHSIVNRDGVAPGEEVLYVGKVSGGPRYGSRGMVKETFMRKAIVDMGLSGIWHIPYYFLAAGRPRTPRRSRLDGLESNRQER